MSWVLPFIVLLGVLIFFHELGHFLVAKYYRVGVERFSIGFGPKLIGKRIGETEYIVAMLPLGGYVKMIGEDPFEEVEPVDIEKSFAHKPLFQRAMIVLAGPVANFLLAFVLYTFLYFVGLPNTLPVVGEIRPGTPAAEAGLQPGDRIVRIGETPIRWWDDIPKVVGRHPGEPLTFEIERGEERITKRITPVEREGAPAMIGISPTLLLPVIGIPRQESPAWRAGLRTGDEITKIDGQRIEFFYEMARIIERSPGKTLTFTLRRQIRTTPPDLEAPPKYETLEVAVPVATVTDERGLPRGTIGVESVELYVLGVDPEKPAALAGIAPNDKIVAVDGKAVHTFAEFSEIVQGSEGRPLRIRILRNGTPIEKEIQPITAAIRHGPLRTIEKTFVIGVSLQAPYGKKTEKERYRNPIVALWKGVAKTGYDVALTAGTFVQLFRRQISIDTLGGPIVIAKISEESYKRGLVAYLLMMAFISVNLGVINLVPIPILDGGHLLLF
ncbi:MAG: RIP metalloprotease RseP, partial [Deltaproteobacteria bacterium]